MFKKSTDQVEPAAPASRKGPSVLGPTLTFRGGELSSDEDLVIEGTIESRIAHQGHQLTIGQTGKVKADVHAKVIRVEGTIEGDLHGDESVHIGASAHVIGNVISPRISIEDGAAFDGTLKTTQQGAAAETATRREGRQEPKLSELAGGVGVRVRRQQTPEGEPG